MIILLPKALRKELLVASDDSWLVYASLQSSVFHIIIFSLSSYEFPSVPASVRGSTFHKDTGHIWLELTNELKSMTTINILFPNKFHS